MEEKEFLFFSLSIFIGGLEFKVPIVNSLCVHNCLPLMIFLLSFKNKLIGQIVEFFEKICLEITTTSHSVESLKKYNRKTYNKKRIPSFG